MDVDGVASCIIPAASRTVGVKVSTEQSSRFLTRATVTLIDGIREEIRDVFPYRHMRVQGAEADDIIATLTKHYSTNEQIIIVSSDKDFQQLQIYPNVRQWSPVTKGFVVCKNPTEFLVDHILSGDSGDGIPNILSDDDCFVADGKRQTPLTSKKSAAIQEQILVMGNQVDTSVNMPDKVKRNWDRNRCMVDFRYIPVELEQSILQRYAESTPTRKGDVLSYLIQHKMKNLMEVVSEF